MFLTINKYDGENMVSDKLQKRIEKLKSENENELRITRRYIDPDDTIFDVASYIAENVDNSFFVIECELEYTSKISSDVYKYSFEVQTVNNNRITDFNMKKELEQKLGNIIDDIGYANNIRIDNKITKIMIHK